LGIYEELGVKRVINGEFPVTRLGGSVLPKEVLEAMAEPTNEWCSIWELEDKVGQEIAKICGAQAAHVTPGSFAALTLSAAACIAGDDPEKMRLLPDTTGMKNEIIIQRNLLSAHAGEAGTYDRSMEVPGGKFVRIGHEEFGARPIDLERAINGKTAAIHFMVPEYPDSRSDIIPLEQLIEIGHKHDVPIIVDAAGQTYPIELLSKFSRMGADLVCFAAKYVLGANAAGWVCGRKDLVDAVALHSFIGQEAGGYDPKPGFYRSIGRGYKMDRQQIVGTLAALRRWVKMDHYQERIVPALEKARKLQGLLEKKLDNVKFGTFPEVLVGGIGYHQLGIEIVFEKRTSKQVAKMRSALRDCDPSIWVASQDNKLQINCLLLSEGDEKMIAEGITSVL
jgi:D-glucosaminate-6-phosphate ammonia-lyase